MEFYSLIDILTNPAIATVVVSTLTAGINYVLGWESRWTALVVSLLVMVGGYLLQVLQYPNMVLDWAQFGLQFVWAGFVYVAAAGISSGVAAVQEKRVVSKGDYEQPKGFQRYW